LYVLGTLALLGGLTAVALLFNGQSASSLLSSRGGGTKPRLWGAAQRSGLQFASLHNTEHDTAFHGKETSCDVLVIGGTPSGIAAALAASRRGADVILVEARPQLGGDIVYAMLNMFDVPARPGEASPVHGIFAEFYEQLGMGFDIERARKLFNATLATEPSLQTFVRTRVVRILKEGDKVTGAILRGAPEANNKSGKLFGEAPVKAKVVIDATNDASFAARAGAGYYLGRENANPDKRMQSAGLLFSVSGVDWNAVRYYVRGKRLMKAKKTPRRRAKSTTEKPVWLRLGGIHGNYAWERGDVVRNYKPRGKNILFLSINLGRQDDNSVVLNTLNIVGVNGLNGASVAAARAEAIRELPYFIAHLRKAMPGFEQAKRAKAAPELYIRETRHIHGYYSLKVADVRAETQFFDRIAMASYPLDLHPYTKDEHNPFGPRRYYYTLPLRSLVTRGVDNVFVASRSMSATYSAAGSARVIPITMSAGEAAGAAAWLCVKQGISPHDMMNDSKWVRAVQDSLREWSADIGDKYPKGITLTAEAKAALNAETAADSAGLNSDEKEMQTDSVMEIMPQSKPKVQPKIAL
jgi:hypothetical protein